MINTFIITILLIALAVTAGLLIFIVVRIMLRKEPWPASTGERLAMILDGVPLPVFEIDSEHKVTQWNSALEALSGIKKRTCWAQAANGGRSIRRKGPCWPT